MVVDSKSMLSLPDQSKLKFLNETNHDVTEKSVEITVDKTQEEVRVVLESERKKVRKGRRERKMAMSRLEKTQDVSVIDNVVDLEQDQTFQQEDFVVPKLVINIQKDKSSTDDLTLNFRKSDD